MQHVFADLPGPDQPILAIDPSLSCTGLCALRCSEARTLRLRWWTLTPNGITGPDRLLWFYHQIARAIEETRPHIAAIEGYSYGSISRAHGLGELGGVIRLAIVQRGLPLIEVPPASHKRVVTGGGNAKKSLTLKELYRRFGLDVTDEDEADAIAIGLTAYLHGLSDPSEAGLPKAHLGGLKKLHIIPCRRGPVRVRTR